MNINILTIFDVITGVLGAYLVFAGLKGYKNGDVDPMLITTEELLKCSDVKSLSKYLMPKTAWFGAFCLAFCAQGLVNDLEIVSFPRLVNAGFLIAFVVVWLLYSYVIHKAKKTYIH